ncbi:transporter [Ruminococcus sp.]|uniref:transporter n=1 Tax=Ruminococcus sp. TaxID=41978 RepID=UPI0038678D24
MKKVFLVASAIFVAIIMLFAVPFVNANTTGKATQYTMLQQAKLNIPPLDFGNSNGFSGGGGSGGSGGFSSHGSDYHKVSSSYEESIGMFIIVAVFLEIPTIVFFVIVFKKSSKKKKRSDITSSDNYYKKKIIHQTAGSSVVLPDRTIKIAALIKENDPNFLIKKFISLSEFIYTAIQYAWKNRDLEPVRIYLHDNLYNQTQKQIEQKIEDGVINIIKDIDIDAIYLTAYSRNREFEYVTVYLRATLTDYEIDENTKEVLYGDPDVRYQLRYTLKFMRNINVKTYSSTPKMRYCPNCGAKIQMSSSGKCKYCGSTITSDQYSWILSEYSAISDDTVDQGIYIENDPFRYC